MTNHDNSSTIIILTTPNGMDFSNRITNGNSLSLSTTSPTAICDVIITSSDVPKTEMWQVQK